MTGICLKGVAITWEYQLKRRTEAITLNYHVCKRIEVNE